MSAQRRDSPARARAERAHDGVAVHEAVRARRQQQQQLELSAGERQRPVGEDRLRAPRIEPQLAERHRARRLDVARGGAEIDQALQLEGDRGAAIRSGR